MATGQALACHVHAQRGCLWFVFWCPPPKPAHNNYLGIHQPDIFILFAPCDCQAWWPSRAAPRTSWCWATPPLSWPSSTAACSGRRIAFLHRVAQLHTGSDGSVIGSVGRQLGCQHRARKMLAISLCTPASASRNFTDRFCCSGEAAGANGGTVSAAGAGAQRRMEVGVWKVRHRFLWAGVESSAPLCDPSPQLGDSDGAERWSPTVTLM